MIIFFFSETCILCTKVIEYINENKISTNFIFFDVDNNKAPVDINIVPTIIDTTIDLPIEGNDIYEYIINQKYFFHPTNNVNNWTIKPIPKPLINEDNKAHNKNDLMLADVIDTCTNNIKENNIIASECDKNIIIGKNVNSAINPQQPINKRTMALLRLKR